MSPDGAARFGSGARSRAEPLPPLPAPTPPAKYTLLLNAAAAGALADDVDEVRRTAGLGAMNKSDVRELLAVLHDDPDLRAEVAARLRARPPRI